MKTGIIQTVGLSIPLLKSLIGKGERVKSISRGTCVPAVWLGLMFVGVNVALLGVQTAHAVTNSISVDFNAASELTGLFNDGYATPSWSQNTTGGISGGGGITIPEGSSDLYICKPGFPLQAGATYTVGAYYYNQYDDGYGGLGFTTLTSGIINGGKATPLSAIGVSFHGGGGSMDNNSAATSSTNSVNWDTSLETAASGWFYFKETLSFTGANTFSQTFEIWQCDTNGNPGTKFTTTTVTGQVNATLGAATTIYPFFGASQSRFTAADSFTATSTAAETPVITAQPTNQVLAVGGTVNLSVTASGPGPLSYQWLKNGGMIVGATNSALTLTSAGVTNSGVYYVVVANANGLMISPPATVTVGTPQLLVWGNNAYGQLGDGTTTQRNSPESVASNVVAMAAGADHSLFLKADGTLWAVGYNGDAELGDGTTIDKQLPECVASNVVAVAAGAFHSLFLKSDGTLWTMGQNEYGQLGNGTYGDAYLPECVASNVVAVAAGYYHSLFVKSDGTLWAMGNNSDGELGDGTGTYNWYIDLPECVASNVVAVTGGEYHSLFLKSDGTLWAMGGNYVGELGDGTTTTAYLPECVASNVVTVTAGSEHSLFVKSDGTLWAMGLNQEGQLGDGTGDQQINQECVTSNVVAVTAGSYHSLFLKNDGTLWAMGNNYDGQLGDGTTTGAYSPESVPGMSLATVASGSAASHTLAVGTLLPPVITSHLILYDIQFSSGTQQTGAAVIGSSGDYWNLMNSASGSASLQDSENNSSSVSITWSANGIYNFSSTFGGGDAALMGGYIYASSSHGISFSGLPANQSYTLYIYSQSDGSGRELSVTVNGTTYITAPSAFPTCFIAGQNYLTISGLTDGGGNISFTYDSAAGEADLNGIQLSVGNAAPSITTQPVASQTLYAGSRVSFTVVADGTAPIAYQWQFNGANISAATNASYSIGSVTTNNAGNYTVIVTNNFGSVTSSVAALAVFLPAIAMPPTNQIVAVGGTVNLSVSTTGPGPLSFQWFKNGGMVLGATNSALTLTSAGVTNSGVYYVVVANANGLDISQPATVTVGAPQLLAWGNNGYGQLGDGTTNNAYLPESVASNVVAVAAGADHSLFLKADGTLWAVGYNGDGELGDGTNIDKQLPECVASNVVAVAAGEWHSLYLTSDGTLWAMGQNNWGQLGDGTTTSQLLPEPVASNVVAVAAGAWHSLFLKTDGTLWAMGNNWYGQLGDGTTTDEHLPECVASNVVAVAAGMWHSLYLTSDGTLWAMGNNGDGELGDGTTTNEPLPESVASNVVAAAAGEIHSLYLTSDGTLWAMGDNTYGELGDGTTNNAYLPECVASNVVAVAAGADHSLFLKADGTLWAMGYNGDGQLGDGTTNDSYLPESVPGMSLATVVSGSSANHTLAVGVVPATATVIVAANPTNAGSVAGGGIYPVGDSNVTLTATASNNWLFMSWSDGTTDNPYTIVVVSNLTVTANFVPAATVATVALPPEGGSTAGDGTYAVGSLAILTATASNGWAFVNWNGTVTNNPWTYPVPSSPTVCTANFAPVSTVTALVSPTNAGSVSGGGAYFVGSNAVLTATASNNWLFVSWNDGVTNNTRVVIAPATNITYTANFAATATITVVASPSSGGMVTGGGTFLLGSTNLLTAVATNGWIFTGWSDGTTSSSDSVVATSNRTFTANFAAAATVTIVIYPTNAGAVVTGGGVYAVGSNAVLTASIPTSTNQNQWIFLNWNGTVTNYTKTGNTNSPLEFTVTSNITVTANFAQVTSDGLVYTYISVEAQSMMIPGIEIIGYEGDATSLVIPPQIDGVPVNEIGPEALTGEKFDVVEVDVDDGITSYTMDGTSIDTEDLEFAGEMEALDDLIAAGELTVAADAVVDCSEVEFAAGATGAVIGFFAGIFSDLAIVSATCDPESGGHTSGSGLYFIGTPVLLTATANSGWSFNGWSDGCQTNRHTVTAPDTIAANFVPLFTVTVVASPTNSAGTVTGDGIYEAGTPVTLTAKAEEGWEFNHWSDGSIEETNEIVVPDSDITYTATFYVEVEGEAEPPTGGVILGNSSYPQGWPVLLTAITNVGWRFTGWFLEADSTNSTLLTNCTTVVVAAYPLTPPLKYKAHFEQLVMVTGLANPTNAGSVAGSGVYDVDDTNITLTATAAKNWVFVNWNDGTTNNPYTITPPPIIVIDDIFTNIICTANFIAAPIIQVYADTNTLTLAWPAGYLGWILQAQTNSLSSSNWFDLPGTGDTNSVAITMDPANPAVFYRLRQP